MGMRCSKPAKAFPYLYCRNEDESRLMYKCVQNGIERVINFLNDHKVKDNLKLMDTATLLLGFLGSFVLDDPTHDQYKFIYSKLSNKNLIGMWNNILQILESDVWSYKMLIDVVCPDRSSRKCLGCSQDINPKLIIWVYDLFPSITSEFKAIYSVVGPKSVSKYFTRISSPLI